MPADLWTPNFNVAMRDSLLWVYEGQTEFWGRVLAARAGMRTFADTLDALAIDAAIVAARPGRSWKSLADSSLDPLSAIGQVVVWRDWQRREDYYPEGVLLWLDVDGRLRERTAGRRGLDDFARAFFGAPGQPGGLPLTYQFDDVCDALGQIAPDDWRGYLRGRLDSHSDAGVLDGLGRAGYRLVFAGTRTAAFRDRERDAGASDLSYSLGLSVAQDGTVKTVAWNGPAFRAGLTVGARITAVHGAPFRSDALELAIRNAATVPVVVQLQVDGEAQEAAIDYRGSVRYPRLERIPGTVDGLAALLRPRRAAQRATP
jgi:predicted metalloprotease with PDZ domain